MVTEFNADSLTVKVYEDRRAMGAAVATQAADKIKELLSTRTFINMIFAAAPSQNEFLAGLSADTGIEWSRINAFHMDEYLGLDRDAPQLFGNFLRSALFAQKPFRAVHYIDGQTPGVKYEAARYTALLATNPPDIVCMGIGENTHLAFNDPGTADFNDPEMVKRVALDLACRQQQVHDGCFAALSQVPDQALTLTIPALIQAPFIFCMVPGKTKSSAVLHTLTAEVSAEYPSTILRTHPAAVLYIDELSYSGYKNNRT